MKKLLYDLIDIFTLNMNCWNIELARTEKFSLEALEDLQLQKLKHLGEIFQFNLDGSKLELNSWDDFYQLPLTSREDTLEMPIEDNGREIIKQETSGSTGEPRTIYIPAEHWVRKEAYFSRSWRWLGWDGQPVLRLGPDKTKWWWYDWWRNVKVLPRKTIDNRHTDYIIKKKPFIIHGRGGGVRDSCEQVISLGRVDVLANTKIVWCGEDATEAKARLVPFVQSFHESYGLAELAPVATPCPYNMHINMECAILEVIRGELYVTDLGNDVMPFIRYKTGDEGEIKDSDCPCGLKHPILHDVKGRRTDYYNGPEVKKPIHWWLVAPLGHPPYAPHVKAWRVEVYPKKGILIAHVVLDDPKSINILESYKVWVKAQSGLDCAIEERGSAENWKRDLVRVFV